MARRHHRHRAASSGGFSGLPVFSLPYPYGYTTGTSGWAGDGGLGSGGTVQGGASSDVLSSAQFGGGGLDGAGSAGVGGGGGQ